ncbi:MAG: nitrogen fixation protein NifK [Clostridiales bacterium]|nr:nitrogen fixation protein NifK [Clostridiales bacterium]
MSQYIQNPRSSCALGGAFATVSRVDGIIPIYHTGPGCGLQTASTGGYPTNVVGSGIPSSNMLEKQVVFGGINRLRDEINGALEVMQADLFYVLTGCAADIIGDNTTDLAEEYKDAEVPIIFMETGGFKGNNLVGHQLVMESFANKIAKKDFQKQDNLVNLFGIVPGHELAWAGNIDEITRLLEKLGLKVNNFFVPGQGVASIQNSSSAALNIICTPWLLKNVEKVYEDNFNIPALRYPGTPIGPTATGIFLREVGEALHLEEALVENVIAEEEAKTYAYLEAASRNLTRYRMGIVGDTNTIIGITKFLANDYSQIPVVIIDTDDVVKKEDKEKIIAELTDLEYGGTPDVFFEGDQWKIRDTLRKYNLTMILGSTYEKETAGELGIASVTISSPSTDRVVLNHKFAGYEGCITLVEDTYYNY